MLFKPPPVEAFRHPSLEDYYFKRQHKARTYSEYNYLGKGLARRVKCGHFEKALRLSRPFFGKTSVLDVGCADGVFLTSLSRYFDFVVGLDVREEFIRVAEVVVENLELSNAMVLHNESMPFAEISKRIPDRGYGLAFLLEVLEHVGEPGRMYEDQIALVKDVFTLLNDDGKIVISVPKMVGLAFLAQRAVLAGLGLLREPMTMSEILRAGFLKQTDELEKRWENDHVGFNHLKLETHLRREFRVVRKAHTFFQAFYVVQRRDSDSTAS